MDFEVIKGFHIESALKRIDEGEKMAGIAESNTYDLVFKGQPYAPKLVVALAYKLATGKNITGSDFDGGEGTACFSILRKNGFVILPKLDLNILNSSVEKIKEFTRSYVNAKKSKNLFSTQHDLLKNIGTKLKSICESRGFEKIIVKTSIGQGSFAEVPWICFFHPNITDKASSGHYPVLLFSADMKSLFFSYCISNGEIEKLGDAGDKLRTDLSKDVSHLRNLGFGDTLKLGGTTSTPKGYENGAIISKRYTIESLNAEVILDDLASILATYEDIAQGVNPQPKISNKDKMKTENILKSAIAAKQFTIIAGGTGTGKTRAARQLAIQIAGEDNVVTVAVGSDWTDNRPLLGFRNLLSSDGKSYVVPAALKLILKADKNLRNVSSPGINDHPEDSKNKIMPHFLILDEMNLSHVERYFADFLSSMESHEPLRLHDYIEGLKYDGTNEIVPHQVDWPKNLFIIGTVNIDETTYMFSPKVLDRAHVIEFKVSWQEIVSGLEGPLPSELPALRPEQIDEFMRVASIKDKSLSHDDHNALIKVLEDLHRALEGSRFIFAHRTARECLNFIASSQSLSKAEIVSTHEINALIDLAILQKVLPKLNGSAGSLSKNLDSLVEFSIKHKLTNCETKLKKMSDQLKNDQFVSFIQ